MTKSELTQLIAKRKSALAYKDVEQVIKVVFESMVKTLATGGRIEIRGFGSFSLHHRGPRHGRNPKSGETVMLSEKWVPHFKPGKELRERVNASAAHTPIKVIKDEE